MSSKGNLATGDYTKGEDVGKLWCVHTRIKKKLELSVCVHAQIGLGATTLYSAYNA